MKANASKHKAMSYGRLREKEQALKREIRELLHRAEAADRDDDRRHGSGGGGDDLPAELARRDSRLKKIREARAVLEERARERAAAEGKDPERAKPRPKDQYNFTDPESRIQKTNNGYLQGYNAQASVDAEWQVIVAQHVTPACDAGDSGCAAVEAGGRHDQEDLARQAESGAGGRGLLVGRQCEAVAEGTDRTVHCDAA